MSSTIFLTSSALIAETGTAIKLNNSGLIGSSSVSSPSGPESSTLSLSNYDQTTPNTILNGSFTTGDFTSWSQTGSNNAIVGGGSYPGVEFFCNVGNISSIYQTVSGFQDKNPVLSFVHMGFEVYVSIELLTSGDVLVGSSNRVFPACDDWVECNMGCYSGESTATKCRVTFYSDNNSASITRIALQATYGYVGVTLGDIYNDTRDTLSISARKLFLGDSSEVINTRPEGADFRTSMFVKGDLTVNGSVFSNVIYGPPGSLSFATNILFSSGSPTQLNWTSGIVQTLDATSYGVSSGSAIISGLTYIYLNLDISSSVLQTTTTYSTVIGNQKIFLGTAQNQSVGNVSFTSQSGQTPIVSGQQLTPSSVTFDKVFINTLSAITASMGALSIDNLLTMKETTSAITIGLTGTLPTSATIGTGIWLDRSGIYSLSSDVQNATLTSAGLTANGGGIIINSQGLILDAGVYPSESRIYWRAADNASIIGQLIGTYGGAAVNSGMIMYSRAHDNAVRSFIEFGTQDDTGALKSTFVLDANGSATFDFTSVIGVVGAASVSINTATSSTNALNTILNLNTLSSGSPAPGLGSALAFKAEDSLGNMQTIGFAGVPYVSTTDGAESSKFIAGIFRTGTSLSIPVSGNYVTHTVNSGNITTGETDLFSDGLLAGIFVETGDRIIAEYAGSLAAHATATRQIRVYFGGTVIYNSTALTSTSATDFSVRVTCIRSASDTVKCVVMFRSNSSFAAPVVDYVAVSGLTLTDSQILKITGQAGAVGAATNDIIATFGTIDFFPTT